MSLQTVEAIQGQLKEVTGGKDALLQVCTGLLPLLPMLTAVLGTAYCMRYTDPNDVA